MPAPANSVAQRMTAVQRPPAQAPMAQAPRTAPSVRSATKPQFVGGADPVQHASANPRASAPVANPQLARIQQTPPPVKGAAVHARDNNPAPNGQAQTTPTQPPANLARQPAASRERPTQPEAADTTSALPSLEEVEGSVDKLASLGLELVEGDYTADEMFGLLLSGQLPRDIASQQNSMSAMQLLVRGALYSAQGLLGQEGRKISVAVAEACGVI
ncbi:hypothetical protein LTR85_004130 [Meristemomyces frigidus]|nr:hypothetical protein LTR85_004130 [Meristemomyces frigidus]